MFIGIFGIYSYENVAECCAACAEVAGITLSGPGLLGSCSVCWDHVACTRVTGITHHVKELYIVCQGCCDWAVCTRVAQRALGLRSICQGYGRCWKWKSAWNLWQKCNKVRNWRIEDSAWNSQNSRPPLVIITAFTLVTIDDDPSESWRGRREWEG